MRARVASARRDPVMVPSVRGLVRVVMAWALVASAGLGCSAPDRGFAQGPCDGGAPRGCACGDGGSGVQACQADGGYGACVCADASAPAVDAVSLPDVPPRCGDNQCNGTETCESCPQDCGRCPRCSLAPSCTGAVSVPSASMALTS